MIQQTWLKYGLLLSVITIILFTVKYYIFDYGLLTSTILSFVVMIIFGVLSSREEKAKNNGYLSYGETLINIFLCLLVSLVLGSIFTMAVINILDPSIKEKLIIEGAQVSQSTLEWMNVPEDVIAENAEKAEEQMRDSLSPMKQFFTMFSNAIMIFVLSAIIAIFMKKSKVEENYL